MSYSHHVKRENITKEEGKWKESTFCTSVGFDKVKLEFGKTAIHVDWNKLEGIMLSGDDKVSKAKSHIRYIAPEEGQREIIDIEGNKKYSSIIIEYPYYSLKIYSPNKRNQSQDTRLLTVHVVPQELELKNLNNYSVNELKSRVTDIINELGETYGIYIIKEGLVFQYAELNRNYIFPRQTPYEDIFFGYFNAAFASESPSMDNLPKIKADKNISPEQAGVFSNSSTIGIHVYNKVYNVEENSKNIFIKGIKGMMDINGEESIDVGCIYRVEFVVKRKNRVKSFLSKPYLFFPNEENPDDSEAHKRMLKQDDIEKAYSKYLKKHVYNSFERTFEKPIEAMITETTQNPINTSDKQWSDKFAGEFCARARKYGISIEFYRPKDIDFILRYSKVLNDKKTIEYNRKRCIDEIVAKSNETLTTSAEDIREGINDINYIEMIKDLLNSDELEYTVIYFQV